jgi:hypothetical protein
VIDRRGSDPAAPEQEHLNMKTYAINEVWIRRRVVQAPNEHAAFDEPHDLTLAEFETLEEDFGLFLSDEQAFEMSVADGDEGPVDIDGGEPSSNFQLLHRSCAPRPRPELHHLASTDYVGAFVKRAFRASDGSIEHLWVKVDAVADGQIHGTVENDPVFDIGYANGDRVTFPIPEIEDISGGSVSEGDQP